MSHLLPTLTLKSLLAAGVVWLSGCAPLSQPLTSQELQERINADNTALYQGQEPIRHPVTFAEALARTIRYNVNQRLKVLELAVARGESDLTRWELLPRVVADAGYTFRDNEAGSRSRSLLSGVQSLEYSTSQERQTVAIDLSMAWNILDFGVTYLKMRQQQNKALAAHESRRKIVSNLVQDVRYAYWKALSAQRFVPKLDEAYGRIRTALDTSRKSGTTLLQNPAQTLEYQMALLEILKQISSLKRELLSARLELASLMSLPPGTDYELAPLDESGCGECLVLPEEFTNAERLRGIALLQRPEIREGDYQDRVNADETTKARLRMLPGIEVGLGAHTTDNPYMFNRQWIDGSLKLAWNLINMVSGPEAIRLSESRKELGQMQRQALAVAVVTQVDVALLSYQQAMEDLRLSQETLSVAFSLGELARQSRSANAEHLLEVIRKESRELLAEMQREVARATVQNAIGRLMASVGFDLLPDTGELPDLEALRESIGRSLEKWQRGEVFTALGGSSIGKNTGVTSAMQDPPAPQSTPPVKDAAPADHPRSGSIASAGESISPPASPDKVRRESVRKPGDHAGSSENRGPKNPPQAVAVGRTKLRLGPGFQFLPKAILDDGTRMTILETQKDWFRVRLLVPVPGTGASEGWVFRSKVSTGG
ncbi:MAG: TolC family protein [Magnetococcales bacterium]|nr:TolC family protein [Magnetococcales bacterium]